MAKNGDEQATAPLVTKATRIEALEAKLARVEYLLGELVDKTTRRNPSPAVVAGADPVMSLMVVMMQESQQTNRMLMKHSLQAGGTDFEAMFKLIDRLYPPDEPQDPAMQALAPFLPALMAKLGVEDVGDVDVAQLAELLNNAADTNEG